MNGDSHKDDSTQMTNGKPSDVDGLLDGNLPRKRPRSTSSDPMTSPSPSPEVSTIPKASTWNDHLIEVARTSYRDFRIPIFGETNYDGRNSNRRFFFEPIVMLDPQSVIPVTYGLHKQKSVRFTIQMWDGFLLSQVQKSLSNIFTGVRKENISIMPFEEVQLEGDLAGLPFSLMEKPTAYNRQNENLTFYILCDTSSTAATLAADLRQNPDFTLKNLPLQLECRGLNLRNSAGMERPTISFNLSTLPPTEKGPVNGLVPRQSESAVLNHPEVKLEDLEAQIVALSNKKLTNAVPAVPALNCVKSEADDGHSFGNLDLKFEMKEEHGSFDSPPGIFGVKTEVKGSAHRQSQSAGLEGRLKDLEAQIVALSSKKSTNVVPVFSAFKCADSEGAEGHSIGYANLDFETNVSHGIFDLPTGIFSVKTAGIYQFNFSGHVATDEDKHTHCFTIRVDGIVKAVFYSHTPTTNGWYQPVSLSALLPLKSGEKVGVYLGAGKLYEGFPQFITRFNGILLGKN